MGCHRPRWSSCLRKRSPAYPSNIPLCESPPGGVENRPLCWSWIPNTSHPRDVSRVSQETSRVAEETSRVAQETSSEIVRSENRAPDRFCGLGSRIVRLLHRDYREKYEWQPGADRVRGRVATPRANEYRIRAPILPRVLRDCIYLPTILAWMNFKTSQNIFILHVYLVQTRRRYIRTIIKSIITCVILIWNIIKPLCMCGRLTSNRNKSRCDCRLTT